MEHITEGIICLDQDDIRYEIAKIEYHYYDDENEKYIFTPYWNVIALLPSTIFQGIPGLDMDLRKDQYIRTSIPVFIIERTPSENRVDLWELLKECNMTYLNRLEWLIRTDKQYFGDNLYVIRFEDKKMIKNANDLTIFHYDDEIQLSSVYSLTNKLETLIKILLRIVGSGAILHSPEVVINNDNRKACFDVLYTLNHKMFENGQMHKRGRKRIEVSTPQLDEVYKLYNKNKITREEAMKMLNITSESTFYRRVKEYKEMMNCSQK